MIVLREVGFYSSNHLARDDNEEAAIDLANGIRCQSSEFGELVEPRSQIHFHGGIHKTPKESSTENAQILHQELYFLALDAWRGSVSVSDSWPGVCSSNCQQAIRHSAS